MSESQPAIRVGALDGVVELPPDRTAVLVVDMENDFGAPQGMFGRAGIDISGIQAAVAPTARVLEAARRVGLPVVYLKMAFKADLSDAGLPDAPNWRVHARLSVGEVVEAPDGRVSRVLVRDTWNTEILPELAPWPGDPVVYKHRFSGFFETELDELLMKLGIRSLVFTGCTTSVCVESTFRDAMFRDYQCILLSDCTAEPIGLGNHESSLTVMRTMFGSVSDSASFISAVDALPSGAPSQAGSPALAR
jgi:ureidoacrylate peracid hydrolase